MRFHLLDRIDAHDPGKFLRGCKYLALGEEYLADHFPRFPVMPGVLMLQSLVEAGAWLWRATTGYRHPVVVLREVKNLKYGTFMVPGRRMDVAVDLIGTDGDTATFKGKGADDAGQPTVSAQFVLHGSGLAGRGPAGAAAEAELLKTLKARWALLTGELRGLTEGGTRCVPYETPNMLLRDQVAIVTGGSRGIGRAVVLALVKEGARVAFVYKGSEQAAKDLEGAVAAAGGVAKAWQGDVADPTAGRRIADGVLAEWGRVDILVNNAGVIRDGLFVRMEADAWRAVLATNLDGAFYFTRAVIDQMVFKQRSGRIVNVSSVAADFTNPGQTNYAASKGAVNSLTRSLAVEVGKRGVTVNAVAPGFIDTDMTEAVRNKAGDLIKKAVPVGRLGKPEDVAAVVVFLCSPAAAYVTGQVITVDGGLSLGAAMA